MIKNIQTTPIIKITKWRVRTLEIVVNFAIVQKNDFLLVKRHVNHKNNFG
mgnify:CR=1 FL=1